MDSDNTKKLDETRMDLDSSFDNLHPSKTSTEKVETELKFDPKVQAIKKIFERKNSVTEPTNNSVRNLQSPTSPQTTFCGRSDSSEITKDTQNEQDSMSVIGTQHCALDSVKHGQSDFADEKRSVLGAGTFKRPDSLNLHFVEKKKVDEIKTENNETSNEKIFSSTSECSKVESCDEEIFYSFSSPNDSNDSKIQTDIDDLFEEKKIKPLKKSKACTVKNKNIFFDSLNDY